MEIRRADAHLLGGSKSEGRREEYKALEVNVGELRPRRSAAKALGLSQTILVIRLAQRQAD